MNNFSERRKRLMEALPDQSVVILAAGNEIKSSEDATYPFYLNRNFYYLTNISQANSILILIKNESVSEYLFIDEYSEKNEKWYGRRITIDEAKKFSGIKEIHLLNSWNAKLKSFLNDNIKNIYVDFKVNVDAINEIKKQHQVLDIYPAIIKMRMKKDADEIKQIEEAIKITHLGLLRVVKELKTAKNECEVFNAFNHEILNHGTHEIGFPSIIATGVHTCCLHYPTPYDKVAENGLILCDVGAAYQHYSSDITRTFPVNGKFNDFQKKVYEVVLETNKAVIKYIRPGRTLAELQDFAKKSLGSLAINKGLIKDMKELDKYYFHNVSHHLGLDVHDAADRNLKLEPGMVITVEPGLYFLEQKTGVRIEDDVLVTETGSKNLSILIPKEINDIEKLF